MTPTTIAGAPVRFDGLGGRLLGGLLQLPFVRYHRVQLGFVETPVEYEAFLRDVVGPRLDALPGRLGIFGVGAHTDLVLKVLPDLAARLHCFTDNNAVHWHRERHGVAVLPPEEAARACEVFFLSTAVYQRVLEADLRRVAFQGPIVAMDDVVPPAWFLGRAA
ncbi:MAG: hypothetical protein R2745_05865 [Vicinamibacterales bacterium]